MAKAQHRARIDLRTESVPEPGGPVCVINEVPLDPRVWAREVPPSIVAQIESATSILVVGDGDADGIGSAVGLARALTLFGKRAVAYSATPPPIEVASILDEGELATGPIGEPYDLVIHVDQYGDRAGPAATAAAENAKSVVVIDHHEAVPNPAYHSWIDTGADAAALLSMGVVLRLADRLGVTLSAGDLARILTPMMAGIRSDTHGFSDRRTRPSTFRILEFIRRHTQVDLGAIARAADPFSRGLKERIAEALEVKSSGERPHRTAVFSLDEDDYARFVGEAKKEQPKASEADVYRLVLGVIDLQVENEGIDLSIAVIARPDFLKVSTRSRAGAGAVAMARAFGGNGKPHEGGANVTEKTFEATVLEAERLVEAWRTREPKKKDALARHVSKWRLGAL